METKDSVIICSTLHEPVFKLKDLILSVYQFLKKHYEVIIVSCTQTTSGEVKSYLSESGFVVSVSEKSDRISSYQDAIKVALKYVENPKSQRIFYIDFDRLLHWVSKYPIEFTETLKKAESVELLHIGRNSRAISSHPSTQKNTERVVNFLGSKILGLDKIIDLISVCFSFTTQLADLILSKKYYTEMGFYCAFPVLLWNYAEKRQYIEVEGLEWETPDRYQEEINKLGYENWLERFQNSDEWEKRVNLMKDCIIELSNLYDFKKFSK